MSQDLEKQISRLVALLTPEEPSFVLPATYTGGVPFLPETGDFVERAGYRTLDQQVQEMIAAGERLQDWREASFPGDEEFTTPVFMDKVDAFEHQRQIQLRFEALQEQRRQARLEQEEAAKRATDDPVEPAPAPAAKPPVASAES